MGMSLLLTLALSSFAATPAPVEALTPPAVEQVMTQRQVGRGLSVTGLVLLATGSLGSGLNVGVAAWNGPSGVIVGPMLGLVGAVPVLGAGTFLLLQADRPGADVGFIVRSAVLLGAQVVGAALMVVGAHLDASARMPVVSVAPVDGGGVVSAAFQF